MSQTENDMDTISSENISRRAVKNPERSAYLWSFFAPFIGMFVIYSCLTVWPLGKNSVLVLDLNAQYVYYFEQLRRIICDGDSLLYTFRRALGGEFMGMFAYYLSSPFSLLVALFPKENITEALYFILLLKTGFCGGFTTFSTFAYETGSMMEKGQTGLALLYVVLSAVLGVLAVFAGQLTVR